MAISRIVPNRFADDARAGHVFFTDILGLEVVMEQPFIATYRGTNPAAQISVVSVDPSGLKPDYSVDVDDVDSVHARALQAGLEIVYALRDEPWGVRRFFVRDSLDGIANIVGHNK